MKKTIKRIIANLEPNLILGKSILYLTPDILQPYDLQGLVLDVDETLVPMKRNLVSNELVDWINQIRPIYSLWLVSNNLSESRIGGIARFLDLPYITGAGKPSRRRLRQAVKSMGFPVERVGMVGDRLFTDVLAGNRLGMFTILVDPISPRYHPIRDFEVRLSKILGVSLRKHSFTKDDKS